MVKSVNFNEMKLPELISSSKQPRNISARIVNKLTNDPFVYDNNNYWPPFDQLGGILVR